MEKKIKVLWTVMQDMPPLCEYLGEKPSCFGGWIYSSLKKVLECDYIEMCVVSPTRTRTLEEYSIDGCTYYRVPSHKGKVQAKSVKLCQDIINDFNPDIIHIHGTEYELAATMALANRKQVRTIVNIQGMPTFLAEYADGGLGFFEKLFVTPLDIMADIATFRRKRGFLKRSVFEKIVLTNATDVVGRTYWDKIHSLHCNFNLQYHSMNETLRDVFYSDEKWEINKTIRHSVFISNSVEPLKGAHIAIRALKILLVKYPDAHLYIIGKDVLKKGFKNIFKLNGYQLYLRYLIKKLQISDNVTFLGYLSENEMKSMYLSANVYVLPSAIENSPNSLCEAQLLGVPVIAAYVGGIPSLVDDKKTGMLYRYEDFIYLASIISDVFEKDNLSELVNKEIDVASQRHDRLSNVKRLYEIYSSIVGMHIN